MSAEYPTWEPWWTELRRLAKARGYPWCHDNEPECWRDYFDDGYTPLHALQEDISYCDS